MIKILPIAPVLISDFCEKYSLDTGENYIGYVATDKNGFLGDCIAKHIDDTCEICAMSCNDSNIADGILRALLFPLYDSGVKYYAFTQIPACGLPNNYQTTGKGDLEQLFTHNCTNCGGCGKR